MLKRLASASVLTMAVGGVLLSATPAMAGGGDGFKFDPDKFFSDDVETYNIQVCQKNSYSFVELPDISLFSPSNGVTIDKDEIKCAQIDPDGIENHNGDHSDHSDHRKHDDDKKNKTKYHR